MSRLEDAAAKYRTEQAAHSIAGSVADAARERLKEAEAAMEAAEDAFSASGERLRAAAMALHAAALQETP